MKKLLATALIICSLTTYAQKVVNIAPIAIFPFIPTTNNYAPKNIAPAATYIDAWRNEGQIVTVTISPDSLSWSWRYVLKNIDSTLLTRVAKYLNATIAQKPADSTLAATIYDFPNSRQLLTHFESDIQSIRNIFATPIATIPAPALYDPYSPSPLSTIMHSFQIAATGASLSIFSPPSLNAALPCSIYIATIARLFPFDNQIVVAKMTGAEIVEMLEDNLSYAYYTITSPRSDIVNPRSRPMSIAGASYTIDITRQKGRRIVECSLVKDSLYTIAMNSHIARKIKSANPINDYKIALVKFLNNNNINNIQNVENWQLIPQKWRDKIKCRESLQIKLL